MSDKSDPFQKLDRHHQAKEAAPFGLGILERLAPRHFYRWPLWKKLALVLFLIAAYMAALTVLSWGD